MPLTDDLSKLARAANGIYNSVTANATAITSVSSPCVCASTSVCSPVICATSCVSAASVCATNLYGNGAGLTGLTSGVVTVCSTIQTCCTAGCLNYTCGNYFKLRLICDYAVCCVLNETTATKLYLDVVTNTEASVTTNSNFCQTVSMSFLPPNTKRLMEYTKVGSKYVGQPFNSATSNNLEVYRGESINYIWNSKNPCCCCCCLYDQTTSWLPPPPVTCGTPYQGLRCLVCACCYWGRYIYDQNGPILSCCPATCGSAYPLKQKCNNFCNNSLNSPAVLVKVNGQYYTITLIGYIVDAINGRCTLGYLPMLHDFDNGGRPCICCILQASCCTFLYPIDAEFANFSDVTTLLNTPWLPRIISYSEQNDLIMTYLPGYCCCGGYITVDKLSSVINLKYCQLQKICLCTPSCNCVCWAKNYATTSPLYHNLDNTANIPGSIYRVAYCEQTSGNSICMSKFKFWKGTTACPICYSCCNFTVCDCANWPCSVRFGMECGAYNTDICGKYLLVGGPSQPETIHFAFGMWMDSCWCSCTITCMSNIFCAQCTSDAPCACLQAFHYIRTDEYLCHFLTFACSNCACSKTYNSIFTRTGDTVSLSWQQYGSNCETARTLFTTNPADSAGAYYRIAVWDRCIYSKCIYCRCCAVCPCGAYGLCYDSSTCCWCRNTASLFCLDTAGYCGNYSLLGDTWNNLRDISNNMVDWFAIRPLTNTQLCAID